MTGFGNSLEEITKELEECEDVINALTVDVNKARNVLRGGKELMLEHPFTKESLGTCHFTTSHYDRWIMKMFYCILLSEFQMTFPPRV